jgi:hypothetical protein
MDPVRHSAYVVAVGRHARVACSAFFLATTLAVGCVSLDKPTSVQKCVAAGNCSDNPNPQPGPDANQDAIESGPDSRSEDKPTTKEDLASDSPIPDAPADQADQGPDQKDVAGTDGTDTFVSTDVDSGLSPADQRDIAGTDGAETGNLADADSGQPIVDSRPDYGPDIVRQDVAPDLGPDVSPDTSTLGSGLLAYYTCEAATGTTLPDSSGKKNDATLVTGSAGTVGYSFAPGKIGNALDLVVVNQGYATLPAGLLATASAATVATWVYINNIATWQRVWDFGTSSSGAYMFVTTTSNSTSSAPVRFAITINGNVTGAEQIVEGQAPLPTKKWTHVAVVLGSTGAVLYVDGVQVGANTAVTLRPADLGNTTNSYIGRSQYPADPYLDGDIDDFRVYNRALLPAEIQALASGS